VARFKDVTARVVSALDTNVPRGPAGQPDRVPTEVAPLLRLNSALQAEPLLDPATASWIRDLAPNPIPGFDKKHITDPTVVQPLSASGGVEALGLKLFPTGGAKVGFETLILEDQSDTQPKLYAVSFPKGFGSVLAKLPRMPFLVYYRPQLAQNIEPQFGGAFKGRPGFYIGYDNLANDPRVPVAAGGRADERNYYPYGWDYLYLEFWRYLNYADDPLKQPWCLGLLYQMAEASTNVVLIIPILSRDHTAGDLRSPKGLRAILSQLQQYLLAEKFPQVKQQPGAVGPVALAGYSSGNIIVKDLLQQLTFVSEINEVYCFDCPKGRDDAPASERYGERWVEAAIAWGKVQPAAIIRLYAQEAYANVHSLVGGDLHDAPEVRYSSDGLRSVALVSQDGWSRLVGPLILSVANDAEKAQMGLPAGANDPVAAGKAYLTTLARSSKRSDYDVRHALIGCYMLRHALIRTRLPHA
jgi:hypothetical protein